MKYKEFIEYRNEFNIHVIEMENKARKIFSRMIELYPKLVNPNFNIDKAEIELSDNTIYAFQHRIFMPMGCSNNTSLEFPSDYLDNPDWEQLFVNGHEQKEKERIERLFQLEYEQKEKERLHEEKRRSFFKNLKNGW